MAKRRKAKVGVAEKWAAQGFHTRAFHGNLTAIFAHRGTTPYAAAKDLRVGTSTIYNQLADGRMIDLPTLLRWAVFFRADINVLIRRLYEPYDAMLLGGSDVITPLSFPDTPNGVDSARSSQSQGGAADAERSRSLSSASQSVQVPDGVLGADVKEVAELLARTNRGIHPTDGSGHRSRQKQPQKDRGQVPTDRGRVHKNAK